ncbi:MAG: NAD-glutamate dehydrogenase [Gammaproteobacteria bacterium]|nr:NAD-glutamate dehydrogenase [Gammaproteobacteria bacterium]
MSKKIQKNRDQIIHSVCEHIKQQASINCPEALIAFAKIFYDTLSLEDLSSRSVADLSGSIISLWECISQKKVKGPDINIYNPTYQQHGWSSKYTVIAVCQEDMPFLVDSITMEVNRLGVSANFIINTGCLYFERNTQGMVTKLLSAHEGMLQGKRAEAVVYLEIDYQEGEDALKHLSTNIAKALHDVTLAVSGWSDMLKQVEVSITDLQNVAKTLDAEELNESLDFLHWLLNDNFTFLGCRDYRFSKTKQIEGIDIVPGSGLGVLSEKSSSGFTKKLADLPPRVQEIMLSRQILLIAKTNTISTVHRPVYTDYIGIKQFDEKGDVVGFRLIIGLYTSAAYNSNPQQIPFLRKKIANILALSKLPRVGHSGKALINILETLPRDDLFQASEKELFDLSFSILHLKERQRTRLFMRKDAYNRYFSCLIYVPRERYDTTLRIKMQGILLNELHGTETSFSTLFTESVLARIHFVIRVDSTDANEYDYENIEQKIIAAAYSWQDALKENLESAYGEAKGIGYYNKYKHAFMSGYREEYEARSAIVDIEHVEKLSDEHQLEMSFYKFPGDAAGKIQLKLYRADTPSPLSDVLPILENMGLRIIGEAPHSLHFEDGKTVWVNDFEMELVEGGKVDVEEIRDVFQEAFPRIWFGEAENDKFNRLILTAQLSWKETAMLRAYARYLKQVGFTFSQDYIADTLYHNPTLTKTLVKLFQVRFDPAQAEHGEKILEELLSRMNVDLDAVASLDEDRILRRYLALGAATLRTNYFQTTADGKDLPYISIKLDPSKIPEMPLPRPMFEIFVYSPRVEGVHLRGAKVARGGIRWSDRREDFRTEILSLMKAQQVKNAVIVPLGAKGGFVPKMLPIDGNREEILGEAIACYQIFMKGLLDITDNIIEGNIVHPKNVVRYDEDDPYLVVAADKGTATFSDIANALSESYGFWLGDAFASGGSAGYDHKKMGITARGAWVSAQRHFRELSNTDIQTTDFTVVGVGDMSGDVFGNGMLMSRHICLVAAFNHMHIFLDPTPDAEKSYIERERLFKLPRSSWEDYDKKVLSPGAAIFRRNEKSLKLTPQIQQLLALEQSEITPNELIKAIFRAKVDMFWNGGIGTFVKAEVESDAAAGDRASDAIRVNANELGCKVVVEGGNLGFTQKARVEFSRKGGFINTDFIDNSAGVDCSDHEVNIKILLNQVMANGDLTLKQRNKLLAEMTDEVAELVLNNNYLQTETLSLEEHSSVQTVDLLHRYLTNLEKKGRINRKIEGLPSDEEILERKAAGYGFSRPEIAVLIAYDKILLKEEILSSDLPEDPYFFDMLASAFPKKISKKYEKELMQHSLRRELIATQLSSCITNAMGINFVHRLQVETGAATSFIIRAYVASEALFDLEKYWERIRALDCKVNPKVQFSMMLQLYFLARRSTRWFLRNCTEDFNVSRVVENFLPSLKELKNSIPSLLTEDQEILLNHKIEEYCAQNVPRDLAYEVLRSDFLFNALDIVQASKESAINVLEVSQVYFMLGKKLELNLLREKMMLHKFETQWDELARASLLDDIDYYQRVLALNILECHERGVDLALIFDQWQQRHSMINARWSNLIVDVLANANAGFIMYAVIVRELIELSRARECAVK